MTPTSATLAKSDKTAEPPAAASATLNVGGKNVELPIRKGTVGPAVIDIGKLYAQTGMFTYDPGFTSTASTESQITYIDGDEGAEIVVQPIARMGEGDRDLGRDAAGIG